LASRDHSISAHYAGGLSLDEIAEQHREADRLNKRFGRSFRILKGIEADILGDGSLDYPDRVLSKFDFVVASVHSRFKMSRKEQTDRILKAIENPHTTIIGHMTGRQLTRRPGYEIEIDKVLKVCAEYGVAVEINAHPWRLDLDWRWPQKALDYGCIFSINPDAHSIRELDHMLADFDGVNELLPAGLSPPGLNAHDRGPGVEGCVDFDGVETLQVMP
jgi:DNA polymerase (family 10)